MGCSGSGHDGKEKITDLAAHETQFNHPMVGYFTNRCTRPAFYPVGTFLSSGVKQVGLEADRSPPYAKVKNAWNLVNCKILLYLYLSYIWFHFLSKNGVLV